MITIDAHAKLNLTLEVTGKRNDGYHEVVSIMQTLDLADSLTIECANSLSLTCSVPELNGPGNLALSAADLLRSETGVSDGAAIHIEKRIPVAAGLGGGSADAAAILVGLNRLWNLELTNDELRKMGAKLGSDVPFLIEGGTATALGRGERVRHLPTPALPWIVIAIPDASPTDKTAAMYRALTPDDFTRGALSLKLEARILHHGGDVPPQLLFNAFDTVARRVVPDVERCWNDMYSSGAREIHVAGSGPAIYAAVERKEIATTIQLVMERIKGWNSLVTRAWSSSGEG